MQVPFTIALAGNPNVGKSTIFNALTGSRQHVGNWPGKTVEKKEGRTTVGDHEVIVVDLPGTYSLAAYSIEEIIARDFIIHDQPSAVVAVVDASNLERNLYLVAQVMELQIPVIVVLNMTDVARSRGLTIDPAALSVGLGGIPVIPMVGNRSTGLDALKTAIHVCVEQSATENPVHIPYGEPLESEITALQAAIERGAVLDGVFHPRWLAIKLLENDDSLTSQLVAGGHNALVAQAQVAGERILAEAGEDAEMLITDGRYAFIGGVVAGSVTRPRWAVETRSDKVDKIVTHRLWGVPLFLLLMWLVFQFTANVSAPFLDWIDAVVNGPLTRWAAYLLDVLGMRGTWVAALLTDGIIAGVGGVLVFVPVLIFLYFAIALLEDSGYMARAAFVMDRVMRAIGLHGKSFLPLIVGFGCTVPAVYATRTLANEHDRKLTGFLATFMSCGARLPVYVVFGAAFFGAQAGNLIFAMYLTGIGIALLTGYVLKRTVYRNMPPQPFVLELPPYRTPSLRDVGRQMWERISEFLNKATTVILASSVVIWLLMALPAKGGEFNHVPAKDSMFGSVAGTIAPVFKPAGFGSWEATGALMTGFVAKEIVVGTLSQIYVEQAGGVASRADSPLPRPDLSSDLREIAESFGEAAILTVQETVNILPRTANLIPFLHIPEGHWLADDDPIVAEQAVADSNVTQGELAAAVDNDAELKPMLVGNFSKVAGSGARGRLAAVAFNVFVLLYVPCMVTVAATRQEFGLRWTLYQIGYTAGLAWLAAVLVFQGGLLLGLG